MKISDLFGTRTFNERVMREKLSYEVFTRFKDTIERGEPMTLDVAECIAHALKEWAIENNATHYTHWFHPLTGQTAEKHDAFIQFHGTGEPIERFFASALVQGEPDASSFPSGGTRTTFEARGYTAWDPQSPCFIIEGAKTNTLCIPSVFFSYNGDSLDKKSALLRSCHVLETAVQGLLDVIGMDVPERVKVTVGAEQEYYLIQRDAWLQREDLMITGRTLIGTSPLRGQKLNDHYFGSILPDVKAYMEDVELALYQLGVPCKTRHNEVAPSQFEMAPIFEEANIAADHNQLMMMMLKQKAAAHGFALLLHEKPFQDLNGSGKHNNWSIGDDRDTNYFSPGKSREEFLRFLCFLVAFVFAVHKHEKFIRASVASASNDHRMGGHEAPPSIMSIFVGEALGTVLESLREGNLTDLQRQEAIEAGLRHIPQIQKDNTDRNRTSPLAFTGNKFEFRAVGSSQALGFPNTVLNAAMADGLTHMTQRMRDSLSATSDREQAVLTVLSEMLSESHRVIFNGNCYSREWEREAEKRGLSNVRTTPEALQQSFRNPEEVRFFLEQGVFNQTEVDARYEIKMDQYAKTIEIEALTLLKLIRKDVRPALALQLSDLEALQAAVLDRYRAAAGHMDEGIRKLEKELAAVDVIPEGDARAVYCKNHVLPVMEEVRTHIDFLEEETARDLWRLPDYDRLLSHR